MKIKYSLTMTALLATLNSGCTPEQMAQFEHDLQQSQQNAATRQRACATAADREWNLFSGSATASTEKSIGSGIYEISVSAQNRNGLCTVTETGTVRGVMNDGGGTYGSQPSNSQGKSSVGADYDRGCADAKAGAYDRSGNATKAYEDGWNACRGTSNYNSPGSDYDRGCSDAKAGSYDRSGNATKAYEDGWNACRR